MKVSIVPLTNGFVIKVIEGEHAGEYISQREGRFASETVWAKLFTAKARAEKYASDHGWTVERE